MEILTEKMLNSISFESLVFRKPFSERGEKHRYKDRVVFFKGLTNIPGVMVVKYIDHDGALRYLFSLIKVSLNNAAKKIYSSLIEKNVSNIEFSFLPTMKREHQSYLVEKLKKEYLSSEAG
jgi:hypothetical protein